MRGARIYIALLLALIAVIPFGAALITQYIQGEATGTVKQAIGIKACNVDVGTCSLNDNDGDGLNEAFAWDMGEVYQGSEYTATLTLENKANQDITVAFDYEVEATGGNNEFEGTVEVPNEITIPAGGTAEATITVNIHPAEEPGEQYTITVNVIPPE